VHTIQFRLSHTTVVTYQQLFCATLLVKPLVPLYCSGMPAGELVARTVVTVLCCLVAARLPVFITVASPLTCTRHPAARSSGPGTVLALRAGHRGRHRILCRQNWAAMTFGIVASDTLTAANPNFANKPIMSLGRRHVTALHRLWCPGEADELYSRTMHSTQVTPATVASTCPCDQVGPTAGC
jgi:hypothetical protein